MQKAMPNLTMAVLPIFLKPMQQVFDSSHFHIVSAGETKWEFDSWSTKLFIVN